MNFFCFSFVFVYTVQVERQADAQKDGLVNFETGSSPVA